MRDPLRSILPWERRPDPAQPDLLARLTNFKHTGADPDAMHMVQCMRVRHTDRRPVSDEPVPDAALEEIDRAAIREGVNLQVLDDTQKIQLASAAQQAAAGEQPVIQGIERVGSRDHDDARSRGDGLLDGLADWGCFRPRICQASQRGPKPIQLLA